MPLVPLFRRASDPASRLRVTPDDPGAITARPKGKDGRTSRRPHTDAQIARVRSLIEGTPLTYGEIAAKTGFGRASICRWTRDFAWQRPQRATDTIPRVRAGQKLKLRLPAERLRALAERHVRELEESANVDPDKLVEALNVLKMARLEAMGRRRRRGFVGETRTGAQTMAREQGIRQALVEMRRGGVDLDRIPQDARDLLTHAHAAPDDDHPALHPRGRRR
jgi:hypothetical protein